jgi:DtxR family Mn-dependent transcriptional regulator
MNRPIKLLARQPYDELLEIEVNGQKTSVSPKFADNILIVCDDCEKHTPVRKRKPSQS